MATVKARKVGGRLIVKAVALACQRDQPEATAAVVRLEVDTGAMRTHVRRQAWPGLAVTATEVARGLSGHTIPAAPVKAHFVFYGEGRAVQLLTARVMLIDPADANEDGLLGMDLLRSVSLKGEEALLTLAGSDGDARLLDTPFGRASLGLEVLLDLEDCGCASALQPVIAAAMGEWTATRPAALEKKSGT